MPSAVRCAYMYACASSPSVSHPAQPISRQAASPSGSVTTMWLFIGSSARRCPGSAAVYPSVHRSTERACTSPNFVRATARPEPAGSIADTGVAS